MCVKLRRFGRQAHLIRQERERESYRFTNSETAEIVLPHSPERLLARAHIIPEAVFGPATLKHACFSCSSEPGADYSYLFPFVFIYSYDASFTSDEDFRKRCLRLF